MQPFAILLFPLLAIAQSSSSSTPASSTSALPAINTGNSQYSFVGCYNETTFEPGQPRALTMGVQLDSLWESEDNMTPEVCFDFCGKNSTKFVGLEYSRECWCGNFLNSDSAHLSDSQCNSTCAGNSSEACGASEKFLLYNRTGAASGAWTEEARYGALYAVATMLMLGFGTLML